jgi:hypothetical protein
MLKRLLLLLLLFIWKSVRMHGVNGMGMEHFFDLFLGMGQIQLQGSQKNLPKQIPNWQVFHSTVFVWGGGADEPLTL